MEERNYKNMNFVLRVHIKKKGRAQEFMDKGKIDVMNFWEQKETFFNISWYRDDLSMVITKLGWPKK